MATGTKLNKSFRKFIEDQPMFFVATAADGRVNLSPKGLDSLRIIDDNRIHWLNLTGSGNESAGHVLDNPRMTLMFCALKGDPLILRLYGTARAIHPNDADWAQVADSFPGYAGSRQVFDFTFDLVQTSCGSGVPYLDFVGQRGESELVPFYDDMGPDGVRAYWDRKNKETIDGRPTGING